MTWNDFKKYIDERLSEHGKDGYVEIAFMAFSTLDSKLPFKKLDVLIEDRNNDNDQKLIVYN